MTTITLSASPKGNGYQATIAFSDGVLINSAEVFPSIGEAVASAATKLLEMPDRLEDLDRQPSEIQSGT
jgi:hypothetical protein